MKALISPNESNQLGMRVAQIEQDANVFEVAEPLFWINCPTNITTEHRYNGKTFVLPQQQAAITPTATGFQAV